MGSITAPGNPFLCSTPPTFPRTWCIKSEGITKDMGVCYNKTITHNYGLWRAENPILFSLPTFMTQLACILFVNRLLMALFRKLHLPRISAEILGGVLMGPSFVSSTTLGLDLFPFSGVLTLETLGNFGLVYYMFLVGLEIDLRPVLRAGKKPLTIAIFGLIAPMPIGYCLHYLLVTEQNTIPNSKNSPTIYGPVIWSLVLATTNFPDLAQILADLKLLQTDVGRTALSSAVITDLFSWILLVLSIAIFNPKNLLLRVISTLVFTIICILILRPIFSWFIGRNKEENNNNNDDDDDVGDDNNKNNNNKNNNNFYNDYHICFVLAGVSLFGFITDACGSHSIVGSFMLGVIMPKGELKKLVMERVEDFVSGLLMPLFFLIMGLRTNFMYVFKLGVGITRVATVVIVAFFAKVVTTSIAALFIHKMKLRDSLALGLLMNTKGLLALIIISLGRDLKVLDIQKFAIMMISIWLMTTVVQPILALTYKSITRNIRQHKHPSIRRIEEEKLELQILTCLHSTRNITSIIHLFEALNPTKESPISICSVQLVELKGHASAMLIVHDTCVNTDEDNIKQLHSNQFLTAFADFTNRYEGVSFEHLTAVSSLTDMHEDICNIANDKITNLVLVPFHNKSTIETGVTTSETNSPIRDVNKNILDNSPCSVAIFVDHGLSSVSMNSSSKVLYVSMLFIGGPDDREALAFACRMSGNLMVNLTIMRFVTNSKNNCSQEVEEKEVNEIGDDKIMNGSHDEEKVKCHDFDREKALDDQYIEELRLKLNNDQSRNVRFIVENVNNIEEILRLEGEMEFEYDLIVVGRGKQMASPILAELSSDWSECPELGPFGDILVSSNTITNASILIFQRGSATYDEQDNNDDGQLRAQQGHMTWEPPKENKVEFAPFVNRRTKLADSHHG